MEKLTFKKYPLSRLLSIRNLTTAHYFPMIQNYATPPHQHAAWEFVFCDHGSVTVYQGREKWSLKSNQIVLHPPNREHHLKVDAGPTAMVVLSFVCSNEYLKLLQNKKLRVNHEQRKLLLLIIEEMRSAFELENGHLYLGDFHPSSHALLGSEQMITGYMEGFLIGLLRDVTNRSGQRWNPAALDHAMENRLAYEIKEYIADHLADPITLNAISNHMHYSRSHITAQFKNATGMTIAHYVLKQRIERAKQLISSGQWTLTQIAGMTGFSSLPYLSKCFKAAVGCCPSAYVEE